MSRPENTGESQPRPAGTWWLPGGLVAAAGVAILLWWLAPRGDELRDEPVPTYTLSTELGPGPDQSGVIHYHRDSAFEWVLRPGEQVEGELGVRAFAFVRGSEAGLPLSLDGLSETQVSGSIRVRGSVGELGLEPGRYSLAIVVGRPEDLSQATAEGLNPDDPDTRVLERLEILIAD